MNFEQVLRNFFVSLSSVSFDDLFYEGSTGKSIPFRNVFPPGSYSVVGNSPISLEKQNGTHINKADYVVRFNNFQLMNYEHCIGSKTDIWITGGGNQAPNNIPLINNGKNMKKILIMNNNKSFKEKQLKIIEKYNSTNLPSFIVFHNNAFLNRVNELLQGTPTTGFLLLLLLSSKYKNINTYGFSFGEYKKMYHYYNDNVTQDYGHRWKKELEMFKILLRKKLFFNNDISSAVSRNTSNKAFYDRHMPKHVKRLYNQRNARSREYRTGNPNSFQRNNVRQNRSVQKVNIQQNIPVNITTPQPTVIDDTNVKLLELNKILRE